MSSDLMITPSTEGGEIMETDFIRVVFQKGFPSQVGINGCRVEHVLDVAAARLEEYQQGPLACAENEDALMHLRAARAALQERINRRKEQGVLNTMSPHQVTRTEDEDEDFSATGA
jgi:hypothetical protein